jgi:hypothetical protein
MDDVMTIDFSPEDLEALREAKRKLEHPSLAARISDAVGSPIEAGLKMLPRGLNDRIGRVTESALLVGLEFAIRTMGHPARTAVPSKSHDWLHRALVVATGTVGGAVGLAALPVELPASTVVILRSIADIARAEGHDLSLLETRLACLEVFALGGGRTDAKVTGGGGGTVPGDEAAETGYWVVRSALSRQVTEAVTHIAGHGLDRNAPVIVRLVARIAQRFSVVVSEEVAAMAVPIVGGVAGGAVNYLFMLHFQELATGHFAVKRLEKTYGQDLVRSTYESLTV